MLLLWIGSVRLLHHGECPCVGKWVAWARMRHWRPGMRNDAVVVLSEVQLSLGRLLNAEFRRPSITVTLSAPDRAISKLFLAHNEFVGKPVTLKIASGTNAADVETRFVGCRKFPGGEDGL